MKYLVNRETKEHKILTDNMIWAHGKWRMVETDDEGWIKFSGDECPLPHDCECGWLLAREQSDPTTYVNHTAAAGNLRWHGGNIVAYRPILPAESKPKLEETWHKIKQDSKVDVFTRLSAAVAASESIPALIAEINAMLHPRFEVRERATPEPVEDMSDWRNWKKGDLVKCINEKGWERFRKGDIYAITGKHPEGVYIEGILIIGYIDDFKFHSRPVTK